jgi:hypothetical protein
VYGRNVDREKSRYFYNCVCAAPPLRVGVRHRYHYIIIAYKFGLEFGLGLRAGEELRIISSSDDIYFFTI